MTAGRYLVMAIFKSAIQNGFTYTRQIASIILMIATHTIALAQQVRLNTYASHVFDERFVYKQDGDVYYKGTINRGLQLGAGVEYFANKKLGFELMYLQQNAGMFTTYEARMSDPAKNRDYNVVLSYILIGGNAYINSSQHKVEGFGGLFAGAAVTNVKNPESGSYPPSTKLTWLAKAGCNFWLTDMIGIRLQAQLSSIIQTMGPKSYLGPVGMSSFNSSTWQFSTGGALIFKLTRG